ncbi:hypothetical protein Droror1_Dr00008176 [Drosera rotundifolia]
MASSGKLEVEVEVKSTPEKIWHSLRNTETVFPQAFPETYKSIELVEGDGKSIGSTRLVKFAEVVPMITTTKERIDEVDEEKKVVGYSVVEGELLNFFKSFKAKVGVAPKGDGSLVTWTCDYEKANEEVPAPELFKDFAVKTFHDLDAYLLKA